MNLKFLELQAAERLLYFEQAGLRRNLSPIIMEKDFWVSWLLGVLFRSSFAGELVFKGGTSLSKVFGVIERFSEDIDLSLSPDFLKLPKVGESRNQANKWMMEAEAACRTFVELQLATELEKTVASVLGGRGGNWFEFLMDPATHSPVLLFHYPTTFPGQFAYLKRSVKLEFGSLTEQMPVGRHPVRPWLAEIFEEGFTDWHGEVVALELERTFWEKATILHAEHHRPLTELTPDRFSRHYADTASLSMHPSFESFIQSHALRESVVRWKSKFFGSTWARYDLAIPGTFRLIPPSHRVPELRRDYQAMRDMYLNEPISFDEVLEILNEIEHRINRLVDG